MCILYIFQYDKTAKHNPRHECVSQYLWRFITHVWHTRRTSKKQVLFHNCDNFLSWVVCFFFQFPRSGKLKITMLTSTFPCAMHLSTTATEGLAHIITFFVLINLHVHVVLDRVEFPIITLHLNFELGYMSLRSCDGHAHSYLHNFWWRRCKQSSSCTCYQEKGKLWL